MGHLEKETDFFSLSICQSSSAICGAKGERIFKNILKSSFAGPEPLAEADSISVAKIIIVEIAVLKRMPSISSETFLIVLCNNFCNRLDEEFVTVWPGCGVPENRGPPKFFG